MGKHSILEYSSDIFKKKALNSAIYIVDYLKSKHIQ